MLPRQPPPGCVRGDDMAVFVHNGPGYIKRPMDEETEAQLPEDVLYRIVRGDRKGRYFGTPGNPHPPTREEFNPRISEVRAGDLAETVVGRKHGIFPDQAASVSQLGNDDLILFRPKDPISATAAG